MNAVTLWQLYRKLLTHQLLQQRLAPRHAGATAPVAAALAQNLDEGDYLGLPPGDLSMRLLCGVPLGAIREAAHSRRSANKTLGWPHPADPEHGLLPGVGEEQAALAVGSALACRLQRSGSMTVLLESGLSPRHRPGAETSDEPSPTWAAAAHSAVALQLPLLFLTDSHAGRSTAPTGPHQPPPLLPSIPVDRADTLALYRVIYESSVRARTGGGPTWIDCRDATLTRRLTAAAPGPTPLQAIEQALRTRNLFDRDQHRQAHRAAEKDFAAWPLNPA